MRTLILAAFLALPLAALAQTAPSPTCKPVAHTPRATLWPSN